MDSNYRWYSEESELFMKRGYLMKGQTLDERVDVICARAAEILGKPEFAQKFKERLQKGFYSLSTPEWANYGTSRGTGIACFNTHVDDNMESILQAYAEVGMMSKIGGGTSVYFGDVRPRGAAIKDNGESSGSVSFMQPLDTITNIVSQGKTRRGSCAVWLPVDHKDIKEFLAIRSEGHPIQELSFGITIPEGWMQSMIDGDETKREIWALIIQSRCEKGYPYIMYEDNVNKNAADVYRTLDLTIRSSNLCTEICLPSDSMWSFVCCVGSLNLLYWDEIAADPEAIELFVQFQDTVLTDFIERSKKIAYMERAVRFAEEHRALGIGVLGWHSYLQSKMIPYESMQAKALNNLIFRTIKERTYKASEKLGEEYGVPVVNAYAGVNRRNTTLMAVAPTTSSAFILGQISENVEVQRTNYYIKDLAKIKVSVRNPFLKKLLAEKGQDNEQVWLSILQNKGSVQHLNFLDENEKGVFKTFEEVSPMEVLIQAAARQKYIDQSQSLNFIIPVAVDEDGNPNFPAREISQLYIKAWEMGIKTIYYQINESAAQEFTRNLLTCTSCEG